MAVRGVGVVLTEHHLDLRVAVSGDGTAFASLSEAGSFDPPIAEAHGASADTAVRLLFASITLDVLPEPERRALSAEERGA